MQTCVRDTPEDRVVGIQQNTARPNASSGGCRGRRRAGMAARGVMTSMDSRPNRTAPQEVSACMVSPRRMPKPDMIKIPVVVNFCKPASAALTPHCGVKHLQWVLVWKETFHLEILPRSDVLKLATRCTFFECGSGGKGRKLSGTQPDGQRHCRLCSLMQRPKE